MTTPKTAYFHNRVLLDFAHELKVSGNFNSRNKIITSLEKYMF